MSTNLLALLANPTSMMLKQSPRSLGDYVDLCIYYLKVPGYYTTTDDHPGYYTTTDNQTANIYLQSTAYNTLENIVQVGTFVNV